MNEAQGNRILGDFIKNLVVKRLERTNINNPLEQVYGNYRPAEMIEEISKGSMTGYQYLKFCIEEIILGEK